MVTRELDLTDYEIKTLALLVRAAMLWGSAEGESDRYGDVHLGVLIHKLCNASGRPPTSPTADREP